MQAVGFLDKTITNLRYHGSMYYFCKNKIKSSAATSKKLILSLCPPDN